MGLLDKIIYKQFFLQLAVVSEHIILTTVRQLISLNILYLENFMN